MSKDANISDELSAITWETFSNWLLYDKKLSPKKNSMRANLYRFRSVTSYFKDHPFNRLEFSNYIAYLRGSNLSNSSINKHISMGKLLAEFIGGGKKQEFADLTRFHERRVFTDEVLTWNEMRQITDLWVPYRLSKAGRNPQEQNLRMSCIWWLVCETGARISEPINLLWADFQGNTITFRDTKNGEDHQVRITAKLAEKMRSLPKINERVFGLYDDRYPGIDLKRRCKLLNITKHVYPHLIRHSVITNLRRAGAKIELIQRLVNHKSIETTLRYDHPEADEIEDMCWEYSGIWREEKTFQEKIEKALKYLQNLFDSPKDAISTISEKNRFVFEAKQLIAQK